MRKVTGVLAFVGLLLVATVTEVPAVAFNSIAGVGSCSSTQVVCAGGFVAITPNPVWTANNPGGSTAVWVSYAQTGEGGIVAPNAPNLATPTATYTFSIATGFQSLSLLMWADDTLGVRLDGVSLVLPNATQGANCAAVGVTCTGPGTALNIPLGGLAHTLQFDAFQINADTHGLMYAGDLQPVPEPASLLLVGSALAAVGFVSRRRMQKKQPQA
jgi:hypothetical protein